MQRQTLEQLENKVWDDPAFESALVAACHRLRKKPIDEFTIEDLRVMLAQNIGLKYLFPVALEVLENNPLAQGDFYPGDLLMSAMHVEHLFLQVNPDFKNRLTKIAIRGRRTFGSVGQLGNEIDKFIGE